MTDQEWVEKHGYILSDNAVNELAAAIVKIACTDYLKARYRTEFYRGSPQYKAYNELKVLRAFFKSSWYGLLCDIDVTILIQWLDDKYEENETVRRKRGW